MSDQCPHPGCHCGDGEIGFTADELRAEAKARFAQLLDDFWTQAEIVAATKAIDDLDLYLLGQIEGRIMLRRWEAQ